MKGRVCLVTGATDGIGRVTALELARRGAEVIVVGRNARKTAGVVEEIQRESGNDAVTGEVADLAAQADIRALAERSHGRHARLDILVNNAGGYFAARQESPDGIEWTFALNHLSYFLLTGLLLDLLPRDGSGRIVNVASRVHQGVGLDFDDLQGRQQYSGWLAYRRSKLANVMFTFALARRLEGTGITANVLHPGFVASKFGHNNAGLRGLGMKLTQRLGAISETAGARTNIYLASAPEVAAVTGRYFYKCRITESSLQSRDRDAQERLWQVSEQLSGLAYPTPL